MMNQPPLFVDVATEAQHARTRHSTCEYVEVTRPDKVSLSLSLSLSQFEMMSDQFFAYDASIVAPLSRVPVWPYTLHHLMPHKCHGNKENCPSRPHQVWELPINELDRRSVAARCSCCPCCCRALALLSFLLLRLSLLLLLLLLLPFLLLSLLLLLLLLLLPVFTVFPPFREDPGFDEALTGCALVSSCSNIYSNEQFYNLLRYNLERHYTSNRAPLSLSFDAAWLQSNPGFAKVKEDKHGCQPAYSNSQKMRQIWHFCKGDNSDLYSTGWPATCYLTTSWHFGMFSRHIWHVLLG